MGAGQGEQVVAGLVGLAQEAFSNETVGNTDAGLVAFERAVARRTLRRRGVTLPWLIVGGAVTAALVLSLMTWRERPRIISFDVVNGSVGNGGYVRANQTGGTALNFSDGSSMALDPGTGARVGDFDAHGGRVLIESGRARIHVNPRPRANWTVDAGPYSVHVIGTEFDIKWLASEEVLDLHLLKGAIVVRGPLARDGIAMEAGAHLFANVRKGEIRLDGQPSGAGELGAGAATNAATPAGATPQPEDQGPSESPPAAAAATTAPVAATAPSARASRPVQASAPRLRSSPVAVLDPHAARTPRTTGAAEPAMPWSTRLARGDFHGVLADAERRGLDDVLTTAPAADLSALADAARFARRRDVARGALRAERTRFPSSLGGREAAFFLGGLSEDEPGEGSLTAALSWYDTYLRENPHGAFVRQVLGRKMVIVQKQLGTAAARPIAAEYLQRFPDGPYAGTARRLLETH